MDSIYSRLQAARKELNSTQAEIAKDSGVALRTYARYETGEGKRDLPSSLLGALAQKGINVNWLLTGIGNALSSKKESQIVPTDALEGTSMLSCGLYGNDHMLYAPLLPIMACCGKGTLYFDDYDIGEAVAVRRNLIGIIDPGRPPFAVQTTGRSMEGYGIREGSIAIVNPAEGLFSGCVVLATFGERAAIKKYYEFRDRIELASCTTGPISFTREEMEEGYGINICGKVVLVIAPPEEGV